MKPKGAVTEKMPELSLHTIDGTISPKAMRLLGQVNRKLVSVLLNTGSTHNFIDPRVIQRTGLTITPELAFSVTIAADDMLHSEGLCKAVCIKCQG